MRYIDRALAGALQDQREAYRVGLAALERYARQTRGAPFLAALRDASDLAAHRRRDRHGHRRQRRLRRQLRAVLRAGARPRQAGHVRRSVLRRQRRLRRLGSARLPGRAHLRRARPSSGWSSPPTRVRTLGLRQSDVQQGDRRSASRPGAIAMPTNLPGHRCRRRSASAPPAASRCCRWPRPGSTSSASRPAPGSTGKDFAPGRDPQQRPRLADGGAEVQSRGADASPQRHGADHARRPAT